MKEPSTVILVGPTYTEDLRRMPRRPWWFWLLLTVLFCGMPCAGALYIIEVGGNAGKMTMNVSRVRNLSQSLLTYAADFDDRLPAVHWQDSVFPYVEYPRDFTEVSRNEMGVSNGFGMNRALLGLNLATVANPESTALLYISHQPGPNAVGGAEDVRFPFSWPSDKSTVIGLGDGGSRLIDRDKFRPQVFVVNFDLSSTLESSNP